MTYADGDDVHQACPFATSDRPLAIGIGAPPNGVTAGGSLTLNRFKTAFESTADNLVGGDVNDAGDVFTSHLLDQLRRRMISGMRPEPLRIRSRTILAAEGHCQLPTLTSCWETAPDDYLQGPQQTDRPSTSIVVRVSGERFGLINGLRPVVGESSILVTTR